MQNTDEIFKTSTAKRTVLVADDEQINREILGAILENDFNVVFAEDGREAIDTVRAHPEDISLVLLDLMMPKLPGIEVLKQIKDSPMTASIPVIVVTADQGAEIECLQLGAIDFISKPYPSPGVILARTQRTIELSEDRETIRNTERDPLTGLYNKEYFYRYAQQFDQRHGDFKMDAIVLDVNHFHLINERYGKARADEILRQIGAQLRETIHEAGGISCRRNADTFLVYCPNGSDYQATMDKVCGGLAGLGGHIRLRMGVYPDADKTLDIERRFDRAKSASDKVRNSFTNNIGFYDDAMHQKELFAEQLIEDFPAAIRENQFLVYYQPKYDIRPETPQLCSAEALVRWQHPKLGMINPGLFIPLFEENGLIQQLDLYVWRATAAQIKKWKERLGVLIPVSVNVSRVDMYDPLLTETFKKILKEFDLSSEEFRLEITESAYTQDSHQIINSVNLLRDIGFQIEMDDFGTGYSSLNMISSLPIDALKLDMQFIRAAFKNGQDTRLIEVIIDIADYLNVPVIAEGVETEEQLIALREMGCDMVQGYYFSKPVPAEEFEQFIVGRTQ